MVKYNVKSSFWQKHDIFSQFMRSFCTWHFLENMFKRCRFWHKWLIQKCRKIEKIKNTKFDMKIQNRMTTRYYFCSINTFWYPSNRFFGFLKLYFFGITFVYFWYISRAEFLPPTVDRYTEMHISCLVHCYNSWLIIFRRCWAPPRQHTHIPKQLHGANACHSGVIEEWPLRTC